MSIFAKRFGSVYVLACAGMFLRCAIPEMRVDINMCGIVMVVSMLILEACLACFY